MKELSVKELSVRGVRREKLSLDRSLPMVELIQRSSSDCEFFS